MNPRSGVADQVTGRTRHLIFIFSELAIFSVVGGDKAASISHVPPEALGDQYLQTRAVGTAKSVQPQQWRCVVCKWSRLPAAKISWPQAPAAHALGHTDRR